MKKPPKTKVICVVQGNYGHGHGWEDLTAEDTRKECVARVPRERERAVPDHQPTREAVGAGAGPSMIGMVV